MSKKVTSQQANRLVALGYNIVLHCSCHEYECIGCKSVNLSNAKKLSVSEALDWIREEKEILCAVELVKETNRFGGTIGYKYGGAFIDDKGKETLLHTLDTHHLASSALLDAVLTYLEQKEQK